MLLLAGAAGVGKSTVTALLGRMGWRAVEVEAQECWPLLGPQRQRCFLRRFLEMLGFSEPGRVVYSNSVLTVAAYTEAFQRLWGWSDGLRLVYREALAAAKRLPGRHVVLVAEPQVLRERILRRLRLEAQREGNRVVETDLQLHSEAQRVLMELAVDLGIPVVDTTKLTPWEAALEVLHVAGEESWQSSCELCGTPRRRGGRPRPCSAT